MAGESRSNGPASPVPAADATELRLVVELAAVRELADRGLSDHELALMRQLAYATIRSARRGDTRGYLDADTAFHTRLLALTGNAAALGVERLLLTHYFDPRPAGGDAWRSMTIAAREHVQFVKLLADDQTSAASEVLRCHVRVSEP